jgi:chaperonin GroES
MNLRPLHDHIIVEPAFAKEKTKGGILLPDSAKEKPLEGKVVAVGPGSRGKDGKAVSPAVKKGDRVVYEKWSTTEIAIADKQYLILKERDILGIVEGEGKVSVRAKGDAAAATAACPIDHVHDSDCCD